MSTFPSPANPTTIQPARANFARAWLRLVAIATGMRAAAPAEVFQAAAVMDAERREGMSTPCAPKAAAERTIAPRFRGSVTLSKATTSPPCVASAPAAMRSSALAYS